MTRLEKTFYGLLLTLVLTFGGLVYNGAINRIIILESHAQEVDRRINADAITLAEIRGDLRVIRQDSEHLRTQALTIEQKLDYLIRVRPQGATFTPATQARESQARIPAPVPPRIQAGHRTTPETQSP